MSRRARSPSVRAERVEAATLRHGPAGLAQGERRGATPRPEEGVVSWNVNTTCNYRCSYCTQRFKEDRGRWLRDTPRFLAAFARLPGRWEIKLSGGEPFVHPTLDDIVAGLAALGHRISVVTNFSADRDTLLSFADAAKGRVGVFSCSLHLEYVDDVDAFREKAIWLQRELDARADRSLPKPHVCVTTVATKAAMPRIAALAERFAGVSFKVQPEKQDREVSARGVAALARPDGHPRARTQQIVVDYTGEEESLLLQLGGHNKTGAIRHSFRGLPCWSGARYFILDDLGDAYRCYPARRFRVEKMGNFLSPSFTLASEPSPCVYDYCNCTVPIARRMMPFDGHVLEDQS